MTQKVYSDKDSPYELDVKKAILSNPALFGKLGKSKVLSEKKLGEFGVIADMLLFSEIKGVIGIEIKTEHDSTQRLNKQLRAYEGLCTEVWVIAHDSQYQKVDRVLTTNNHPTVGIITYSTVDGEIMFGKIKRSSISSRFNVKNLLKILWKSELLTLANRINSLAFSKETNLPLQINDLSKGHPEGSSKVISNKATKMQIITFIINRLGPLNAYQMVVDLFIQEVKDPAKVLNYYSFKKISNEGIEIVNGGI